MKHIKLFACCLLFISLMQSCLQDKCTSTLEYIAYEPVTTTLAELRKNEITTQPSAPLENPGKIYFYKNFLLVNEQGKGIHFFDVSNASDPKEVIYYHIHGNFDMAIKDDLLMVDDAVDIISIDIKDIFNPFTITRIYDYKKENIIDANKVITSYVKTNKVQTIDCSSQYYGLKSYIYEDVLFSGDIKNTPSVLSGQAGNLNSDIGIGGSFARFTIFDDYLYAVDNNNLRTYKINSGLLDFKAEQDLAWGIETIFPYKDKLFIGSNSGMFIFDNSNPERPQLLSNFTHSQACDPVFVDEDKAYVTLRNGNTCQGFINQLDIIDISNITSPQLIKSYEMVNPHGLSIHKDVLYLCEGTHGLKTLNISDANNVTQLGFDTSVKSYDAITISDDRLFIVGDDGFYQYNTKDPDHLVLLSKITVHK